MRNSTKWVSYSVAAFLVAGLAFQGFADQPRELIDQPGFRPQVEGGRDAALRSGLKAATIAVYPTAVRTVKGVGHDESTRDQFVKVLTDLSAAKVTAEKEKVALSTTQPEKPGQYGLFLKSLQEFGKAVKASSLSADYALSVEYLVGPLPSGGLMVGGIHVYLVDAQGENVHSFLLNSHHRRFAEAKLTTPSAGQADQEALVQRATQVATQALREQLRP